MNNFRCGQTVLHKNEEYKIITYAHDFGGMTYLILRKSDGYEELVVK